MKKRIYFGIGVLFLALAFSIHGNIRNSEQTINQFFLANLEALAQDESTPQNCDTGYCGRCWVVKRFGLLYKCVWTGDPNDTCDCIYLGYV